MPQVLGMESPIICLPIRIQHMQYMWCMIQDSELHQARQSCISCKTRDHASWATCPTFVGNCAELDTKLLENQMLFFPTGEAWTHISQPSKVLPPAPLLPTQSTAVACKEGWETVTHQRGRHRQTTLLYGQRAKELLEHQQLQQMLVQPRASLATSSN